LKKDVYFVHCAGTLFQQLHFAAMTYHDFSIVIGRDTEGYYIASMPELRGCHTQVRSLDTLMERITEAIDLCLEDDCDNGSLVHGG
jgi:predicted RNase H-like HicB family nuclease